MTEERKAYLLNSFGDWFSKPTHEDRDEAISDLLELLAAIPTDDACCSVCGAKGCDMDDPKPVKTPSKRKESYGERVAKRMVNFGSSPNPNINGLWFRHPDEDWRWQTPKDESACEILREYIADAIDAARADAVKEEREACARLVDNVAGTSHLLTMLASDIRARGGAA